jgi:hypothetical protein
VTSHCAGCPVQPLAAHVRLDRVRHEVAHRQSGGEATPDEGAGDVDPWHVEEAKAAIGAAQAGQLRGDVRAGEVLALRDAQVRELEHGLRLAPRRQRVSHVTPDDERQLVSRRIRMQRPQGIDRERRSVPPHVDERDAEPGIRGRDRLAHRHAVGHTGLHLPGLVWRHMRRNEQYTLETELDQRLLRTHQMAEVGRVEGAAEQTDARHAPTPVRAGRAPRPRPGT